MNRTVTIAAVFSFFCCAGVAECQIKVVKKPAPAVGEDEEVVYETWTSSWGLRDDAPDQYPLGVSVHKSELQARVAAKLHMARTANNGSYAVTHYLIEGEPTVRSKSARQVEQAMDLLGRLREAKAAVDHAKKVAKGEASVFKARERKLGDTIREYRDAVARSYRQIVETKKTLTGGVASLTNAKLGEVNRLIDQYNRQVGDFGSVMGSTDRLGYAPLDRVQAADADQGVAGIVGTWNGESVQGNSRLSVVLVFNEDGTVSNRAENGRTGQGTWTREGDTIQITWSTGATVRWQLRDGTLGGTGTTSRGESWSISFRKR